MTPPLHPDDLLIQTGLNRAWDIIHQAHAPHAPPPPPSPDIGPTTACFECGSIFAVGDACYRKVKDEEFCLCPDCYETWEEKGRAREKPGEPA